MTSLHEVALITGASSGLGARFAHILAREKWDLVITGRRLDRLEALRDEIEQQYGVSVRAVCQDLSKRDSAQQLFDQVQESGDLVRVLVNNAGLGHYGPMMDQSAESVEAIVQINLASVTRLTRLFAGRMKAAGGGYILQNASFSGLVAVPRYSIYAATKSYVVSMGLSLRYELRRSGVHLTVLCPGFTTSEFFGVAGIEMTRLMRPLMLDPQKVAEAGISGLFRDRALIVPGAIYKVFAAILRVLPRSMACALAAGLVKNRSRQP